MQRPGSGPPSPSAHAAQPIGAAHADQHAGTGACHDERRRPGGIQHRPERRCGRAGEEVERLSPSTESNVYRNGARCLETLHRNGVEASEGKLCDSCVWSSMAKLVWTLFGRQEAGGISCTSTVRIILGMGLRVHQGFVWQGTLFFILQPKRPRLEFLYRALFSHRIPIHGWMESGHVRLQPCPALLHDSGQRLPSDRCTLSPPSDVRSPSGSTRTECAATSVVKMTRWSW